MPSSPSSCDTSSCRAGYSDHLATGSSGLEGFLLDFFEAGFLAFLVGVVLLGCEEVMAKEVW